MARRNIELKNYYPIFSMTQSGLRKYLKEYMTVIGKPIISDEKEPFLFYKGTVPVLLVAHMDTVHDKPVSDLCISADGNILMSPQGIGGDDRCGIMMIMEILKVHDCSVLFAEDEEIGCVGSRNFSMTDYNDKLDVNYIVEIDRRGSSDAVYYDCSNNEFEKFVTSCGFKTAIGSYSDICEIAPYVNGTGVAAVNISSGYFNEHTKGEYVDVRIMKTNTRKLINMIGKNTMKFEWASVVKRKKYRNFDYFYDYDDEYPNSYLYEFEKCGKCEKKTEKKSKAPAATQKVKSNDRILYPYHGEIMHFIEANEDTVNILEEPNIIERPRENIYCDDLEYQIYEIAMIGSSKLSGIAVACEGCYVLDSNDIDYESGGELMECYDSYDDLNKTLFGDD